MALQKDEGMFLAISLAVSIGVLHFLNNLLNIPIVSQTQPIFFGVYVSGIVLASSALVGEILNFKTSFTVGDIFKYWLLLMAGLILIQILFPTLIGDANIFIQPVTNSVVPLDFRLFP